MTTGALEARLKTVTELFGEGDAKYTIPIYQRNYAWGPEQIEQLISDVRGAMGNQDGNYFLGNLIVTERDSNGIDYEVIDGQQRLTTLYLLLTYLGERGKEVPYGYSQRLRYQSRTRSTNALRRIASKPVAVAVPDTAVVDDEDDAILQGFNVILQFMEQWKAVPDELDRFSHYLKNHVAVVRTVLPKNTDVNRYFEIMNTRGQQLEQVDIVKARLMAFIGDREEQTCFAWIWEACADMDSYVQMSLTRDDTEARNKLFGDDWGWLPASTTFDEFLDAHRSLVTKSQDANPTQSTNSLTLVDALKKYANARVPSPTEDQQNVRFRSVIDFPAFLLHVLKVWERDRCADEGGLDADEGGLDDTKLIKRFEMQFDHGTENASEKVRKFLVRMLRCRNYFDACVIKRQFTGANDADGDWSLLRLVKGRVTQNAKASPRYIATLTKTEVESEDEGMNDRDTQELLLIESMLRVTYTSPRTMHWITLVLSSAITAKPENSVVLLRDRLRSYARDQVGRQLDENGEPKCGFNISRIVFTYVDYLLALNQPNGKFRFTFRNSIEHFYPQSPDAAFESAYGKLKDLSDRELFGNLALVTVRDNSKFTNSPPCMKAKNERIVLQSPKLGKMADIAKARDCAWDSEAIRRHHKEMVDLLRHDRGVA